MTHSSILACRAAAFVSCFAIVATALAQDGGDLMPEYSRAKREVEALNQIVRVTETQMVDAMDAIGEFANATTPEAVERAMESALAAFRRTERSLENLNHVLRDVSDSFQGLTAIEDWDAGAILLEVLQMDLKNVETELSGLADGEVAFLAKQEAAQCHPDSSHPPWCFIQGVLAGRQEGSKETAQRFPVMVDIMKLLLLQSAIGADREADLLEAGRAAPQEMLEWLSAMMEVVKITNDVNRTLLLALALHNAPNAERRESLERIIGEFQTPREAMRVNSLLASLDEATAAIISGWLETESDWFLLAHTIREMDRRPREETCEQCTDGLDNDLNGLTDADQSASCRVFVQVDPTCTLANAS